MIGKLRGIVDFISDDHAIIDVSGVGYYVFCSANTLRLIGDNDSNNQNQVSLFIETHVREDHIHLYGFASRNEQKSFIILQKVNGVGAKMALSILSVLTPESLASAIISGDKNSLKNVSGVGERIATRIITELKDKFSDFNIDSGLKSSLANQSSNNNVASSSSNDITDAVNALVNLGYSRQDCYRAVMNFVSLNDNYNLSTLIKAGLKSLSR